MSCLRLFKLNSCINWGHAWQILMKLTCDAVAVKEKDVMQEIEVIQNNEIVRLYHSLPFKS
jgi:hypothetical protein